MIERQRKIIKRRLIREVEFPNSLEGRLNSILNVINTESKSLIILLLEDIPRTSTELMHRFHEASSRVWTVADSNISGICSDSLVNIGMVCEEGIIYETGRPAKGWSIKEAGKKFGKPAAAFALEKALVIGKSMHEILGSTSSPGNSRSPLNRFLILDYLRNHRNARMTDLEVYLKLELAGINSHLNRLRNAGIINFSSVSSEESGLCIYYWVSGKPDAVKTIRSHKTLTKYIANYLFEHGQSERNEIAEDYHRTNGINPKFSLSDISIILSGIERQGFSRSAFKGGKKQSDISLTEEGEYITNNLIQIREFLEGRIDIKIRNWEEYVEKAILLYRNVSPSNKGESFRDRCGEIYELIASSNGIRSRDIERQVGVDTGRYLRFLVDSNLVVKERNGKIVAYRIANQNRNNML